MLSLALVLALVHVAGADNLLAFELKDVTLAGNTFQAKAAASNREYILGSLDVNRKTAALPTPGEAYKGSWEDPSCELRGHFVGHYLSALSSIVLTTDDPQAKERLDLMVSELSKVQQALGGGYLSAFPSEHFDRVESLSGVWAPYYVIHKIMQGLVDAHLVGNKHALEVVSAMADYFHARSAKVITAKGKEYWARTLETEFGGMNEVMYRLYRITKKDTHLQLAGWFDKPKFYNGLLANTDVLPYNHANTHLAQVVGFAERYDTTNEDDAKAVVSTFFDILTTNHSFSTGGSNWKEFWQQPATLAEAVLKPENAIETQEICTQYNILKIARALFRWTGDVKYADFYEKALVNGILGVSRLSADEVLGQEEDNLEYLSKLLHKYTGHSHDHHEQGVHAHMHVAKQQQPAGAASYSGSAQELMKGSMHMDGDLVGNRVATGGVSEATEPQVSGAAGRQLMDVDGAETMLGLDHGHVMHVGHLHASSHHHAFSTVVDTPANGEGITWTTNPGATTIMQGDINIELVPATHFHRAAAAGRTSAEAMYEASKRQEPSWVAGPEGDVLSSQKSVSPGEVAPWQRMANWKWQNYWGYNMRIMDKQGQVNVPGTPGSFLYLLALGSGQSKRENVHHWGYPLHSFWCCYGTAVESFAKLGDSIYFWRPGVNIDDKNAGLGDDTLDGGLPNLYINQYVSSTLAWHDMGLVVIVSATMYAPGAKMIANITFTGLDGAPLASGGADVPFTLNLRIPVWASAAPKSKALANLTVNGQPWGWQDGESQSAGSYMDVTRRFKPGDVLSVSIGHKYWLSPLRDIRPQYSSYASIMMGPYVMAGLTHDASWLTLPTAKLDSIITEPPAKDALVSVQSAHNRTLYLRHDHYHTHTSLIEDSGDALDATFVLKDGCQEEEEKPHPLILGEQRTVPRLGQQLLSTGLQAGQVVSLEAMGTPGFFLGALNSGKLVWEQRRLPASQGDDMSNVATKHLGDITSSQHGAAAKREFASAADKAAVDQVESKVSWCDMHSWRVVPGLDGGKGTFSLELVGKKDHYMSAALPQGSPKCEDEDTQACTHAHRAGLCISEPELWLAKCPLSCQACKQTVTALQLVKLPATSTPAATTATTAGQTDSKASSAEVDDTTAKAWASWLWAAPSTPRYPPGAKVVKGSNRQYLLAPIGNLVDERYTVYFRLTVPAEAQSDESGEGDEADSDSDV